MKCWDTNSCIEGNDDSRPASWAEIRPGDVVRNESLHGDKRWTVIGVFDNHVRIQSWGDGEEFRNVKAADLELDCDFVSERRRQHPSWMVP